jgi:hypothetical protein
VRHSNHTFFLCCVLASALAAPTRAAETAPLAVFAPAEAAPPAPPQVGAADVIRSRLAFVPTDALRRVEAGQRLALDPFPDLELEGLVHRAERRGPGHVSIAGTIDGRPGGRFNLSVVNEAMAMRIALPEGNVFVDLAHRGEGVHLVRQRDPARMQTCAGGVSPPADEAAAPDAGEEADRVLREILGDLPAAPAESAGTCTYPNEIVIDAMLVYTPAARTAAGGTSAVRAACYLGVDLANQAYEDSLIDLTIRAVICREVDYDETSNLETDLTRLEGDTDGFMDQIHDWRDDHFADQVTLVVDSTAGGGLAECIVNGPNRSFAVVQVSGLGTYVYAHEVGHNQGCAHDRLFVDCSGAHDYSYGWRFAGDSGSVWHTIMAYPPGMVIGYFSNPDVDFDGQPTGVPIGEALQSDNANTIQLRRGIIPDFFDTHFEAWVSFDYSGTETGTFFEPFDTIAEATSFLINGTNPSEPPSLWIKEGSTMSGTILAEPMLVRNCGGSVIIGGN